MWQNRSWIFLQCVTEHWLKTLFSEIYSHCISSVCQLVPVFKVYRNIIQCPVQRSFVFHSIFTSSESPLEMSAELSVQQ